MGPIVLQIDRKFRPGVHTVQATAIAEALAAAAATAVDMITRNVGVPPSVRGRIEPDPTAVCNCGDLAPRDTSIRTIMNGGAREILEGRF